MPRFALACLGLLLASPAVLVAQSTPEERGFLAKAPATASGEEISRQGNLWVMEVRLKPMRMVAVQLTDPRTGEKKRTLVWYVVYQAVNRPLARRDDSRNLQPVNEVDPPPGPPQFVPEFTLVTNDNDKVQVYHDEILPEAIAAISKREKQTYANGVKAIGDVPAETPFDATDEQVVTGVATFRGVDPATDFFTLLGTGFTNGYQITDGPDTKPLVWRKTLVQKYWRPGDQFEQNEAEFRFRGEPTWIYRPDEPADPLEGLEEKPATDADDVE